MYNCSMKNNSPWLHELARTRPALPLSESISADVVIVGGGIAGITTAYYTLRDTNHTVVLVEADKVAHGATGHNAGQLTSYYERPLHTIETEYGLAFAKEAQQSVEHAWSLLDELYEEINPKTPLYRFTGHLGLTTRSQVHTHLKNCATRERAGLSVDKMIIRDDAPYLSLIDTKYENYYTVGTKEDVLSLLETENNEYTAVLSHNKGCANSARLTEEIAGYLLRAYKDRFRLYEESPVTKVRLHANDAKVFIGKHTVTAHRVVLCTNGFESFSIENVAGPEIDSTFHHMIEGYVGYMSAYKESVVRSPVAISYQRSNEVYDNVTETYYYVTRRPFDTETKDASNLISIGGPGRVLAETETYSKHDPIEDATSYAIDAFLRENYKDLPQDTISYEFHWHGLMGYTPNAIRKIGVEPVNPVLLYNLGCNGVGLLLSIFGGTKIARHLRGDRMPPSVFDPVDQRNTQHPRKE
jgi:glycine/D-amino acid oxidase-like deaminating enzyme